MVVYNETRGWLLTDSAHPHTLRSKPVGEESTGGGMWKSVDTHIDDKGFMEFELPKSGGKAYYFACATRTAAVESTADTPVRLLSVGHVSQRGRAAKRGKYEEQQLYVRSSTGQTLTCTHPCSSAHAHAMWFSYSSNNQVPSRLRSQHMYNLHQRTTTTTTPRNPKRSLFNPLSTTSAKRLRVVQVVVRVAVEGDEGDGFTQLKTTLHKNNRR